MRSNLGRLASLACTLPLLVPCGVRAGYDLTLSMSDSDPHANVSMTPVGIDTLYLWLNCSEQGASALDATLEGDIDGPAAMGRHAVAWDGLGTDGSPASSGAYFIRASAGSDVATVKSILVK